MWCRVDFSLTEPLEATLFRGHQRTPERFRKTLAALDTQYRLGLPSAFFGYGPDATRDPQAEITFGIGTTGRGLVLTAIGAPSCECLFERSGAINAALMHAAQGLVPMHVTQGEHEADFIPFPMPYKVARLAVGETRKNSFWMRADAAVQAGSNWMDETRDRIAKTISHHLMRQAVFLAREGDDLDGNVGHHLARSLADGAPWSKTGKDFGERLDVRVTSVGGHTFAALHNRPHRLMLTDVAFTMKATFSGPWFVGRLKGEAQGMVLQDLRATPPQTVETEEEAA